MHNWIYQNLKWRLQICCFMRPTVEKSLDINNNLPSPEQIDVDSIQFLFLIQINTNIANYTLAHYLYILYSDFLNLYFEFL